MKKLLKGLKFFFCYIAITLVTATGVVVVSQNTSSNINNENSNHQQIVTQENSLMDIVSQAMKMEHVSLYLEANLENAQNPEESIAITLDVDANLLNNFSTIELNGQLDIDINNNTEDIFFTYVDNTAYISALEKDFSFTTNNIINDASNLLSLLNIQLPNLADIDLTAMLGLIGNYNEEETENGRDIALEFMGYNIAITCDQQFNLKTVSAEDIVVEGYLLDLALQLEVKEEGFEISIPEKNYINLDYITRIFTQANTIKNNGFISANVNVVYKELSANVDIKADFANQLNVLISSEDFGGIDFVYTNDGLFAKLGNIQIKTSVEDVQRLIRFIQEDLKQTINIVSPQLIETVKTKVTSIIESIKGQAPEISLGFILSELDNLNIAENCITYSAHGINAIINFEDNNIISVVFKGEDFSLELKDISLEKEEIVPLQLDYLEFEDIFSVAKKLVNTLNTKGFAGTLSTSIFNTPLNVNFGIKFGDSLISNLNTSFKGQDISFASVNENLFLSLNGVKVKSYLDEIPLILDYLNTTFGINISLPDLNSIASSVALPLDISFIKYLKAIDNGLELQINDFTVQVITNANFISKVNISSNSFNASIRFTSFGDISLDLPDAQDFLSFQDVSNHIDNALDFINYSDFNVNLKASTSLDGNDISLNFLGDVNANNIQAQANASLNSNSFDFDLFFKDNILVVDYQGLALELNQNVLPKALNILYNIIPNYLDISDLLNSLDNLDFNFNIPENIDYLSLLLALNDISLSQDSLSLNIDLSKFDQNIPCNASLTLTSISEGYTLDLILNYADYNFLIQANVVKINPFVTSFPDKTVNVENILDLVSTLDNTISSKNLDLDINASFADLDIQLDATIDFSNDLRFSAATSSLGSNLDIRFVDNTFFLSFGNINLAIPFSSLDDLLTFYNGELKDALHQFNIEIPTLNTSSIESFSVDFDLIKNVLYALAFEGDCVVYDDGELKLAFNILNNSIYSINVEYLDMSISCDVAPNTDLITVDETKYYSFDNLLTNVKALINSLVSRAIKTTVTVNVGEYSFEADVKINYINDTLAIEVEGTAYGQYVKIVYYNQTIYLTINELNLKVSWEERYSLADYLNSKFNLNIDIDKIVSDIEDTVHNSQNTTFALEKINVDFLTGFIVKPAGLFVNLDGTTLDLTIATLETKAYISSLAIAINNIIINANNFIFGNEAIIEVPSDNIYANYTTFANYFDKVESLINASYDETTDQYNLRGNVKVYKLDENGNTVTINGVEDHLAISINDLMFDATKNTFQGGIDATGAGTLYANYLTGYDHSFDAAFDYNFIYFNYNGLKAKFSKQSNSEFITVLKKMIPTYLGQSGLTDQIMDIFNLIKFDATGNLIFDTSSVGTFDILKMLEDYAPLLSTLRLEEDNSLTIELDLSNFVQTLTENLVINVWIDNNDNLAIRVNKFKVAQDIAIDFTLYVHTENEFVVNPIGSFMDMTSIGKLLGDFDNTAQSVTEDNEVYTLNVSGTFHLKIKVSFININEDIPFSAQLIIDRNSNQLVEAKIYIDMPSITLVTSGCQTTLYLTNRLEGENILYIDRKGKDPLKSKYKASELGNNLVKVISDITAMSESTVKTFVSMDIKYIDGPSKAENVLKNYTCTTGLNSRDYIIGLDLRQITLMDMMLGYSESNPTSVVLHSKNNKFTSIDINNITLEAISGVYIYLNGTIDLENISQKFDLISEIENLDPTLFGTWSDGSLIMDFVENGGTNVPNKMGTTGRSVTLPIPVKEIVNGNTLEVYDFLGWSLNSDGSGTLYNGTYMFGTQSVTFYAVWKLNTIYTKHTITYSSEYLLEGNKEVLVENNLGSITEYNSYDISSKLPQVDQSTTIYYEDSGMSVTYAFQGFYITKTVNSDGTITYSNIFTDTVMPNSDITVYAYWKETSRAYQRKLAIYDQDKTLYEDYYTEGSKIDILSLVTTKSTTKWYDDYNSQTITYSNEIAKENLPSTMPVGYDLTLYIRNIYTVTYQSTVCDKVTSTQTGYQGEALKVPTHSNKENIVYKEDKTTPNFLETFVYDNYYLSTDSTIVIGSVIPNSDVTYVAKWDYITTSYVKISFNTGWAKPSAWLNTYSQTTAPGTISHKYVLVGSTLNGTTLSKKTSVIGLTPDQNETVTTTCRYKYGIYYTFGVVNWNQTKNTNHNVSDYSTTSHTITKETTFYCEWKCTGSSWKK